MPGDLHNHSTCSDGSVPIHRLPLMAARVGLDTMAISDHDTLLSVQYCYDHPTQDGVRLIPATELTGYDYERSHRVHLLAFWPDPESKAMREHCDIMRQRRNECCLQSAREIEVLYPQFRTEQALEYAKDSGVLYKSGSCRACVTGSIPACTIISSGGTPGASCSTRRNTAQCGMYWLRPKQPGQSSFLLTRRSTRVCRWCGSWSKRE